MLIPEKSNNYENCTGHHKIQMDRGELKQMRNCGIR
jgi:hypothetical protein